jgi:hypothetical protein
VSRMRRLFAQRPSKSRGRLSHQANHACTVCLLQNNPFSVPLQEAITDTVGTDDVQVTFDASVYLIK